MITVFAGVFGDALAQQRPRLAVMDLWAGEGISAGKARSFTGVLRTYLIKTGKFTVINRSDIEEIARNHEIELAICSEDACLLKLGMLLAAEKLVVGDIGQLGGGYLVNARLVNIAGNTLEEEDAATRTFQEGELLGAMESLAAELAGIRGAGGGFPGTEVPIGDEVEPWRPDAAADVFVRFESEPAGAMLEIDSQLVGETPTTRALAPGFYRVAMKKLRYLSRTEQVVVKPEMAPVSWTLQPNFGWLTITSRPRGLALRVNDEGFGRTPISRKEMNPGTYRVIVADPKYHESGRQVVIERGEHEEVSLEPTPRQGGVKIEAVDRDGSAVAGTVFVDGSEAGRTWAPITLIVGRHEVEVRSEGGHWSETVEVTEGKLKSVPAKLGGAGATGELFTNSLGMELVRIPAGSFQMGSPSSEEGRDDDERQHRATISKAFYLGKTEVTQGQWQAVMGDNPSRFGGCGDDCPVEKVSWFDAVQFCNRLSEREGLALAYKISGEEVNWNRGANGYRLPTEAEWEYACRAETTTRFNLGDSESDLKRAGWYYGNSGRKTHPVGEKKPNGWGFFDMHGNVWEWCWSWYGDYPSGAVTDSAGPDSGKHRVLRGGSWFNNVRLCRSATRDWGRPLFRYYNLGFRLALDSD